MVGLGFGRQVQPVVVDWDDVTAADWAWMCERAAEFWQCVESGNPPDVDGSDHTSHALAAIYPKTTEGAVASLDSIADDLSRLEEIKHLQAAVTKLGHGAEVIENRIKALMGDAEIGTLEGEPLYVLRTTKRKGHTVAPSEFRSLRRATKSDKEKAE
jgi:predicted phage-related endonuclease